jgi:hypothetical protein
MRYASPSALMLFGPPADIGTRRQYVLHRAKSNCSLLASEHPDYDNEGREGSYKHIVDA